VTGKNIIRLGFLMAVLALIWGAGGLTDVNGAEAADGALKRALLSEAVVKNTGTKAVSLNFNGVPLNDALLSLGRQAGASITIDREIDASKVKVSAYYEGESFEEAIETIVSGLDYALRRVIEGSYVVTPYEEAILNVHDVYVTQKESLSDTASSNNRSLTRTSQTSTIGGYSNSGTSTGSSGSSSTGEKTEDREMSKIMESIKKNALDKGGGYPNDNRFRLCAGHTLTGQNGQGNARDRH